VITSKIGPTMPRKGRLDWPAIRDKVDLAKVATALLGPALGRRGERGRRLYWRCPFHEDNNPSFAVTPGKPHWKCFGCGEHGDAAALVMKLNGMSFPDAVRWLGEQVGIVHHPNPPPSRRVIPPFKGVIPPARKAPQRPSEQSTGLPHAEP
jgi:hypothetical protein